ncbi:hypothetical protein Ddc_15024 [Ditylenchus destructor]|nr:hypothetical protein Ddc_15024 [Ditylenchus destructor]
MAKYGICKKSFFLVYSSEHNEFNLAYGPDSPIPLPVILEKQKRENTGLELLDMHFYSVHVQQHCLRQQQYTRAFDNGTLFCYCFSPSTYAVSSRKPLDDNDDCTFSNATLDTVFPLAPFY